MSVYKVTEVGTVTENYPCDLDKIILGQKFVALDLTHETNTSQFEQVILSTFVK